jgi:hypothetical protein
MEWPQVGRFGCALGWLFVEVGLPTAADQAALPADPGDLSCGLQDLNPNAAQVGGAPYQIQVFGMN